MAANEVMPLRNIVAYVCLIINDIKKSFTKGAFVDTEFREIKKCHVRMNVFVSTKIISAHECRVELHHFFSHSTLAAYIVRIFSI